MIEIFAIGATLAAGGVYFYALNTIRTLRARAEQAERQRDVYKKWWDELTVQWKGDRQALSDALDSSNHQADALEVYRRKLSRDTPRGPDGRFVKKGAE